MSTRLVLIANAGDSTISTFRLANDALRPLSTTQLPGSCSTFAVDEARSLVYAFVKGDPPRILTLALDWDSGELSATQEAEVAAPMAYLTLTRGGNLLLGASYHQGIGQVWPVSGGVLGATTSTIEYPNLHCVVATTAGDHAYFVSLGADLVAQYSLSGDGSLTPMDPPTVAAPRGSGARHLVLSADETNAYLVTEYSGEVIQLARGGDGGLVAGTSASCVAADAGLGHSRFGADPTEEHLIWGADVQLAHAGGFVLASERSASTIATIAVDQDGSLGGQVAIRETEAQPRGFAVTQDGTRAIVVGERATHAILYAIEDGGSLTPLDRQPTGRGANWVRIISG